MPSPDRLYHYLLAKGADSKQIASVNGSMEFICQFYGLETIGGSKTLKKKVLGALRNIINAGEDLSKERIVVSALAIMSPDSQDFEKDIYFARSKKFYQSQRWRNLRLRALEKNDGRCEACGAGVTDGITLHVDHILPRSVYPEYALSLNNLQILCEACNMGKGNVHKTNFRRRNNRLENET